jgi:hypothetical protein
MALRTGGDVSAGYDVARGGQTVFKASLADRTQAAALDSVSQVTDSLGRQLGRLVESPSRRITPTEAGCAYPWSEYCESVFVAVADARARGKSVVVVSQPRVPSLAERHAAQQAALRDMLARQFADDSRVRYVDTSGAVDMSDTALCYDGMHLTPAGNARLGATLSNDLIAVVRAAQRTVR